PSPLPDGLWSLRRDAGQGQRVAGRRAYLQDPVQTRNGDDLRNHRAGVGQHEAPARRADPAVEGDQSAQGRAGDEADVAQVQHEAATGRTLGQAGEFLAGGIAVVLVEMVEPGEADEGLVALAT